MTEQVGVVILAAGRSERMKEFKALLPFDRKACFLERIITVYAGWGCREIVVVANPVLLTEMERQGLIHSSFQVVVNGTPELERFYSVKLGLGAITTSDFCFLQNVDNPFIDHTILDLIYGQRSEEAYVSPVFHEKGGHPVLLNRRQINRVSGWLQDDANLKEVLGTMACRKVEMHDDRVLININSPEEYARFLPHCPALTNT